MKKKLIPFLLRIYGPAFSPLTLAVWISAVVMAVVAGPFGTFEAMDPLERALYWGAVVSASVFVGYTVRAVARAVVGPGRPGLFDAFGVTLMTLVFAPVVWGLARLTADGAERTPPTLAQMVFYVFLVTGVIFVVRRLIPGIGAKPYRFLLPDDPEGDRSGDLPDDLSAPAAPEPEQEQMARPQRPRLMRRLPAAARSRILRLAASDHQVEVVTQTAAISLRMRLKDAIDEMEPVQGYRIHRSHWVARDAVVRFRRDGPHKLLAELVNGDQVPVSRKYRSLLKEAGIVEPPGADG